MREILFRGKRVDNGEWIDGFYAKSGDRTFILIDNDFAVGYVIMKEVYPETVGQFTGLTDKNGKKIFEGDIIEYEKDGATYEIIFVKENGITKCRDKVIGNVHDNPELLEVKK